MTGYCLQVAPIGDGGLYARICDIYSDYVDSLKIDWHGMLQYFCCCCCCCCSLAK